MEDVAMHVCGICGTVFAVCMLQHIAEAHRDLESELAGIFRFLEVL